MGIIWVFIVVWISLTIKGSECIYAGTNAEPGWFPYAVSIREYGNDHYCGGAIINEQFIITSAVCLEVYRGDEDDSHIWKPRDLVALAGVVSLDATNGTLLEIEEVTRHEGFNISTLIHDLALCRTKEKIEFTDFIAPVGLPSEDIPPKDDLDVTVAGWGFNNESETNPEILQYLQTKVMNKKECGRHLRKVDLEGQLIDKHVLCTMNTDGGGICQYDQGSPLVDEDGILVGVASWFVLGRCGEGFPDVFTQYIVYEEWSYTAINESDVRIAHERWIESHTDDTLFTDEVTDDYSVERSTEDSIEQTEDSREVQSTESSKETIEKIVNANGTGQCCICNCNQHEKTTERWKPQLVSSTRRPFPRRQFLPEIPMNWSVVIPYEVDNSGTETISKSMVLILFVCQVFIYIVMQPSL